eukprot:TRINITY_DN869_c0_g1_i1.p1 TRINITY_DN869_c0_g1~~TRINITY_DN869_c0_g1_i1.p1  ORF type:complete len:160 (+),score=17.93 TRINITY_DN869_c0_g1_i1:101-580(+)
MLLRYQALLQTQPFLVNALTSSVIASIGDLAAQTIVWRGHQKTNPSLPFSWDPSRALRVAAFGFCLGGPTSMWFRMLERRFSSSRQWSVVLKKIFTHQLIYANTVNFSFFVFMQTALHWREGPVSVAQHSKVRYLLLLPTNHRKTLHFAVLELHRPVAD